jgi:hypothetical protein
MNYERQPRHDRTTRVRESRRAARMGMMRRKRCRRRERVRVRERRRFIR